MMFSDGSMTVEELRAYERSIAESKGTTLEAEMDELEQFTRSKAYADAIRLLLGVKIRED